jgi:RNA 3'-terminal phosphate cyclase (ATP)
VQVDYLLKVFQPIVSKMGVNFDLAVTRRGFFPKGGGEIRLHVPACPDGYTLSPIRLLKRGGIVAVHVWTFFGGKMPRHVADRITAAARATLQTGLTDRGLCTCLGHARSSIDST